MRIYYYSLKKATRWSPFYFYRFTVRKLTEPVA